MREGAPRVVRRQHVEQPAQDRLGVADQRDRRLGDARRLLGIGIDADDREIVVDAPLRERHEQMGADAEHDVGLGPQFVAERQRDAQADRGRRARRGRADRRAPAPAAGAHSARDLGGRILRAAAGDDQRPLGARRGAWRPP